MTSSDVSSAESRDLLSRPSSVFLAYILPAVSMAITGFARLPDGILTGVWATALVIMGLACVANALKCGRVHCYLMGPFFLLLAGITVLYGLGMLALGNEGWSYIALSTAVGSLVLYYVPERIRGKYRGERRLTRT